jgi:hypothetical protein
MNVETTSSAGPRGGTDLNQVTIWATLTDDTPRTITALLNDPRTDDDTHRPTPAQDTISHSGPGPITPVTADKAASGELVMTDWTSARQQRLPGPRPLTVVTHSLAMSAGRHSWRA